MLFIPFSNSQSAVSYYKFTVQGGGLAFDNEWHSYLGSWFFSMPFCYETFCVLRQLYQVYWKIFVKEILYKINSLHSIRCMGITTIVQSKQASFLSMDCKIQYLNIPLVFHSIFLSLRKHLRFLGPVFNQWKAVLCVF